LALQVNPDQCEDERGKSIDFVPVVFPILKRATKIGLRESNYAAIVEAARRIV
jgi:hypothetical protein